jgi:hypothetical protein
MRSYLGSCGPAAPVTCGSNVLGTNVGGGNLITSSACAISDTGPEQRFEFVAPATGQVTVQLQGLTADIDLIVLGAKGDGTCDLTGACIGQSTNGGTVNEKVVFTATAGVTYYFIADGYAGSTGPFNLTVSCP